MKSEEQETQRKLAVASFLFTVVAMVCTAAIAWGRMAAVTERVDKKLDSAIFEMYLAQSEKRLESIEKRLENIQASIDDVRKRTGEKQ